MSDENSVLQDDLRDMCRALGLPDGARPQSPHEVFRECIAAVEQMGAHPPTISQKEFSATRSQIEKWLRDTGNECRESDWQSPYREGFLCGLVAVLCKMDDARKALTRTTMNQDAA